jgi:hypothetical protein
MAVVCGVLAGCSATAQPTAAETSTAPAASAAPSSPQGPLSGMPGESPGDSALRLEALLGQHAVLAADLMRGRIRGDEDFGQAANVAIGRNTDELAGLVGALFGDQAATGFRTLWTGHVTALFNYSRGLATNDAMARDDAKAKLVAFETGLADFFSSASKGRLPQDAARAAVQTHVDHLLQQADAYAAKDYPQAESLYRANFAHTFDLGHSLATTLLPPDASASLQEPSWRLRSALDRLLGEHVALAVAALRAGGTMAPDFAATADALNGNTKDLAGAIGTLFGDPAGQQFLALWADHVDHLVMYAAGAAANDDGRRQAARAGLHDFEGKLAAFLDSATSSKVPATDLAKALTAHDDMLTQQVDAFVRKDFRQAHELAFDTYQDMFGMSRRLSDAFGEQVAAKLPKGGAETGVGGTAPR